MPTIALRAPAKVNLALSVGPAEPPDSPRPGWHPIASWIAPVDLCDEVHAETLSQDSPSVFVVRHADDAPRPTRIDWPVERDLAFRALRALESHVGRTLPTRLTLTKRIPIGAGLGGGSSDAASALMALNTLHGLSIPVETLTDIAQTLGSDVPFFMHADPHTLPHPSLVSRFGEVIERLSPVHAEILLIVPGFSCATPEVYAAFDRLPPRPLREAEVRQLAASHTLDPDRLFNDLAPAACAVRPELARLLAHASEASGFPAHLTGSGSAMFVITPPERARALASHLAGDPLLADCALVATHLSDRPG
ncbi:MAG: hypothetical protein KF838_10730 [Phycisphaeraceae bacterium]|nr:MAG: hypothetical protein KF838_10730 [Phycisphaeraceae bacterium]